MGKINAVNLDITNNPDGFDISGGTTSRKLTVTGADITLSGSGTATITFPTTSTTLAGLGITQSFTAPQTFSAGMTASHIRVFRGATFDSNLDLVSSTALVQGYNTSGYLKVQSVGYLFSTPGYPSIVFQDADTDFGGVPSIKINPTIFGIGSVTIGNASSTTSLSGSSNFSGTSTFAVRSIHSGGLTTSNLWVSTGATFGSRSSFTSGITASQLFVSGGATFGSAVVSDGGYRITSNAISSLTGTSHSLTASDNGKVITLNNASQITFTIPSGLPVGFNTTLIQIGAGTVAITAAGTTLNSFEGKLRTAGQHAAVSIISYGSNIFNIAGGLSG